MKKVFFLIGTLSTGGAERVVSNISLFLPKKNIYPVILLFSKKSKIIYNYKGEIIYLDTKDPKNVFGKLYAFIKRIIEINKIKKENPNEVMISFLEYPNLLNLLTKNRGKLIVSVRNYMSIKHKKGFRSILWNMSIKYLYGKADKIIAVSEEVKKDLIHHYKIDEKKIKVIYNPYPIEKIIQLSNEKVENKYETIFKDPVIITAGRLVEQKGHKYLIRTFSKVKESIDNVKLVILGEGEIENELKKLTKHLGVENDVYFLGFQKNPFKYISRSKVFVLSSHYEGFPNALVEAMICGIPVVSTDCLSGPREILAPNELSESKIDYKINKERYGILCPKFECKEKNLNGSLSKEENIMADSIIALLQDNDLWNHFSKKAKERSTDFHIENIITEWETIINNQ